MADDFRVQCPRCERTTFLTEGDTVGCMWCDPKPYLPSAAEAGVKQDD